MELVKPGGEFLFANFSDEITTDGYMETFMDWPLILRSADDMRDIINAALGESSFAAGPPGPRCRSRGPTPST